MNRSQLYVVLVQGLYFLVTGLWPLVSIGTFQMVTGPKTDLWLVKTVAVLITVIAAALLVAVARREFGIEIRVLAIGSSVVLSGIDIFYVAARVISPVYLLDAVAEFMLIAWWAVILIRRGRPHGSAGFS